jgi:hypothetical protein
LVKNILCFTSNRQLEKRKIRKIIINNNGDENNEEENEDNGGEND